MGHVALPGLGRAEISAVPGGGALNQIVLEGSGGTLTVLDEGAAAVGAGAEAGGSWPTSGDFGAAGVVVVFFVFFDGAFATCTFFRQALRWELLLILLQEAVVAVFGLAVGAVGVVVGAGMVSSCAKDGAAKATAARAAMLAIKRRMKFSRAACGEGTGAASLYLQNAM